MEIKDILKNRRIELEMTQLDVAKAVGVSEATVSRWESGDIANMRRSRIADLAKALRISPSVIMGWDDESESQSELPPGCLPMPKFVKKPRLGTIACGEPILAVEDATEFDDVPDDVTCDFTLLCKGDSMINARIFDGDIVYIRKQDMVDNGEIAAVLIGDETTLKRVHLFEDHIVLSPENPMYKPFVYWGEEMNAIRILGKAVAFKSLVR